MGYSIELYFEQEFETKLRSLWDMLEKDGVPSILQKIGSRPHLSLLILDECDIDHITELIDAGIKKYRQFAIVFSAISLIPGRQQTVFLSPVVNSNLFEIQRGLYNIIAQNGYSIQEYYKPPNWLPHCSISKELSSTEALKTIEVCQYSSIIGETLIIEVGLIKFRPRQEIITFDLANNNSEGSKAAKGSGRAN